MTFTSYSSKETSLVFQKALLEEVMKGGQKQVPERQRSSGPTGRKPGLLTLRLGRDMGLAGTEVIPAM